MEAGIIWSLYAFLVLFSLLLIAAVLRGMPWFAECEFSREVREFNCGNLKRLKQSPSPLSGTEDFMLKIDNLEKMVFNLNNSISDQQKLIDKLIRDGGAQNLQIHTLGREMEQLSTSYCTVIKENLALKAQLSKKTSAIEEIIVQPVEFFKA
ncbi:hypothetical protein CHISP_0261 [Chitinispirillum alkaliphilum]|nr:hypothetical protein CHISP_0261 [Chitinispirillum alkaliphilum]